MQPMMPIADPTAVVGKRIGAAIVDVVLMAIVSTVLSLLFLNIESMPYDEAPRSLRRDCGVSESTYGESYGPANDNVVGTSMCFHVGDTIWFVDSGPQGLVNLLQLVIGGAIFWWWQGTTGKTPGKVVFGIRTVNGAGQPPGILAAFLRQLLWIVDLAPYCIPGLVGLITASSSKGHRRVGDMVASTYVIDAGAMGVPVPVAGNVAAATGWATPMPGAPMPGQPMPGAPMAPAPGAAAAPPPAAAPSATPAADDPSQPRWDADRNAYIAWDAAAQRWQQFDEGSQTWTPI